MAKTFRDLSDTQQTRLQETGSAWIFKRAIQDNKSWATWEHIKKDDDTMKELKKIWLHLGATWNEDDDEWLQNFHKQYKTLVGSNGIGRPEFTEFTRDGNIKKGPAKYILPGSPSGETFMEWVENYLGDEFKIGNKDNWNPADIWLIYRQEDVKKEIKNATKLAGPRTEGSIIAQLNQFNAIFRKLFQQKRVIGISLKKVSGKEAVWKEINVTDAYFHNLEATTMKLTGIKCYLGTKRINIKKDGTVDSRKEADAIAKGKGTTGFPTIETQDSWLIISDEESGTDYKIQIKNTSSQGPKFDNLKFEPTEVGMSSARMGKATREFVFDLMRTYTILQKFPQTWQQYPQSKATDDKPMTRAEINKVERQIRNINTKASSLGITVDWGGVDFVDVVGPINIRETLGRQNERWTANSKLQQIAFINAILSQTKEKTNKFCTDLVYLAAKQGRKGGFHGTGYGPFGKLY